MYKKELIKILEFTPSSQKKLIASKHGICKSRIVTDFFKTEAKDEQLSFSIS